MAPSRSLGSATSRSPASATASASMVGAATASRTRSVHETFEQRGCRYPDSHRTFAGRAPLPDRGLLDGLPPDVVARAEWWERHVIEVLTGTPPAQAGTGRRPEYDPLRRSLRQRELDKVAELNAGSQTVSLTTLGRMRRRYQREGLLGLVDGRLTRTPENTYGQDLETNLQGLHERHRTDTRPHPTAGRPHQIWTFHEHACLRAPQRPSLS